MNLMFLESNHNLSKYMWKSTAVSEVLILSFWEHIWHITQHRISRHKIHHVLSINWPYHYSRPFIWDALHWICISHIFQRLGKIFNIVYSKKLEFFYNIFCLPCWLKYWKKYLGDCYVNKRWYISGNILNWFFAMENVCFYQNCNEASSF